MLWQLMTLNPSIPGAQKENKPEKEATYESSKVGKIVNVRKDSDPQVDNNDDQKGE